MASRTLFAQCLRAAPRTIPTRTLLRPFTTTPAHFQATETTASTPNSAIPPTDPGRPLNPSEPLAPSTPTLNQHLTLADKLALRFRNYLPNTTETYIAFDITRQLYTECALQAAYADGVDLSPSAAFWYTRSNRPTTFSSWAQVTMLHMWMLAARMRALDKQKVGIWQQHFIDHFFYDAEDKMIKRYGIKQATRRTGYMKDLYHQYRGMTAAFDEGLMKGDAVLATAIWRNVFDASDDVDLEVLAMVVSHVRRAMSKLSEIEDEVILSGRLRFGTPDEEESFVRQPSSLLEEVKRNPEILPRQDIPAEAGAQ